MAIFDKLNELNLINFSKRSLASPSIVKYSTERRGIMGNAPQTTKLIQSKVDYAQDYVTFYFLTEATEKYGPDHEYTDTQPEHQFALERNPSELYEIQLRFFGVKKLQELIASPKQGTKSLQQKPVAKYPTGEQPATEPVEAPEEEPVEPIPEPPEEPEESEQPEVPPANTNNATASAVTPGQAIAEPNPDEEIIRHFHNRTKNEGTIGETDAGARAYWDKYLENNLLRKKKESPAGAFLAWMIEAAGDILREMGKEYQDTGYIREKTDRLRSYLDSRDWFVPITEEEEQYRLDMLAKLKEMPQNTKTSTIIKQLIEAVMERTPSVIDVYLTQIEKRLLGRVQEAGKFFGDEEDAEINDKVSPGQVDGGSGGLPIWEAEPKKPDYSIYNMVKNWLWATDFALWSNAPSFHWQGFNYNMSIMGASIHPTNIEPQHWDKIHGDALIDKHLYDLFLHVPFFINQMASSLLNKLRVKKESIEEGTDQAYYDKEILDVGSFSFRLIENPTEEDLQTIFKDNVRYAKAYGSRVPSSSLRYVVDFTRGVIWVFSVYLYHIYAAKTLGLPYSEDGDNSSNYVYDQGVYSLETGKLHIPRVNQYDFSLEVATKLKQLGSISFNDPPREKPYAVNEGTEQIVVRKPKISFSSGDYTPDYDFLMIKNPDVTDLERVFKDNINYARKGRRYPKVPVEIRYIVLDPETIWVFSSYCLHDRACKALGIDYCDPDESDCGIGHYSISTGKLHIEDYEKGSNDFFESLGSISFLPYTGNSEEEMVSLEEGTESPEGEVTHYLHEYLKEIEGKIEGIFDEMEVQEPELLAASDKSKGNLQEKEPERAKWLFNPEVDLSPDRKRLIFNIVGTLKKFERKHRFYGSSAAMPEVLRPYFLEIIYEAIQALTGSNVLKVIELSSGRESLFTVIYENVQSKNREILTNNDSVTFEVNGKNITLGAKGMPVIEYYKAYAEKPLKAFEDPAKYTSMLRNRLKTKVGEAIGISYFMRDFQIPGNQYQRALKTMPHDTSNFPDFLVSFHSLDTQSQEHFKSLLGFTPPDYIFFDTKATVVTGARPGMGNERLQYPRAGKIHEFLRNQGILGPDEVLFDTRLPEEHPPTNLTYEDFIHLVKYFISSSYDPASEEGYLTGKDLCIIYQEVGKNVSTRAKYYLVDIMDGRQFQIKKISNSTYHVLKNGTQKIAVLNFYAPEELKNKLPPHMRNAQKFNISKEIMAQVPIEEWSYMLKWAPEGLEPIQLQPYEPTYSPKKLNVEELEGKE